MTSDDDKKYPPGLRNFWVYCVPEDDGGVTPLLFIDRGATVLHVDPRGTAFLSDSITRKLRQELDEDVFGRHNGVRAYHEGGGNGDLHVVCLFLF